MTPLDEALLTGDALNGVVSLSPWPKKRPRPRFELPEAGYDSEVIADALAERHRDPRVTPLPPVSGRYNGEVHRWILREAHAALTGFVERRTGQAVIRLTDAAKIRPAPGWGVPYFLRTVEPEIERVRAARTGDASHYCSSLVAMRLDPEGERRQALYQWCQYRHRVLAELDRAGLLPYPAA